MMELHTSTKAFDSLHDIADSRKQTVKVDREALINLLMDHSAMLRHLQESGIKVTEPVAHRVRPRLNDT